MENLSSEAITSSLADLGEISALEDLADSSSAQAECSNKSYLDCFVKIVERIAMELRERL